MYGRELATERRAGGRCFKVGASAWWQQGVVVVGVLVGTTPYCVVVVIEYTE